MNRPSIDEARLRPHLRMEPTPSRYTPGTTSISTPVAYTASWQHPNPQDLRGIPVVGRGVPGCTPGTNPEHATIQRLSQRP